MWLQQWPLSDLMATVAFGSQLPTRAMRKQSPAARGASRVAFDRFTWKSGRSLQHKSECPTVAWGQWACIRSSSTTDRNRCPADLHKVKDVCRLN
jgi:hypothetical protein